MTQNATNKFQTQNEPTSLPDVKIEENNVEWISRMVQKLQITNSCGKASFKCTGLQKTTEVGDAHDARK